MSEFPPQHQVPIALTQQGHDRAGHLRTSPEQLEASWSDSRTRVLLLAGGQFPVLDGDQPRVAWLGTSEVEPQRRAFLGIRDGVHYWLAQARGSAIANYPDLKFVTMYQVGQDLAAEEQGLLIHAQALANWWFSHRFCPRCGRSLHLDDAGHVLRCETEGCTAQHFPRADPAVIMLVTDGDRALLGHQASWPAGRFSTLAGFVDPGESFEAAVRREVAEEVGVRVGEVAYFGNQPWPFPASMMIGFFAQAETTEIVVNTDELAAARWFSRKEIRELAESGEIALPGGFSISRSLIEAWYGDALPGRW